MLDLACPSCGSENTQKLSLTVGGGTLSNKALTIGGSQGGGLLAASTSSSSTTKLAEAHAPPQKRSIFGTFGCCMLLAALVAAFTSSTAIAFGLGIAVIWVILNMIHNAKVYPPALARWQKLYLCLRCSELFTPKQIDADATPPKASQ